MGIKYWLSEELFLKLAMLSFLTNTTTALGFGTFIFTDSEILIQFGIVASVVLLLPF